MGPGTLLVLGPRSLNIGGHETVKDLVRAQRLVAVWDRQSREFTVDIVSDGVSGEGDYVDWSI